MIVSNLLLVLSSLAIAGTRAEPLDLHECGFRQGRDYKIDAEVFLKQRNDDPIRIYELTEFSHESLNLLAAYYRTEFGHQDDHLFVLNKFADPQSPDHDAKSAYKLTVEDGQAVYCSPMEARLNTEYLEKSMDTLLAPLKDLDPTRWTPVADRGNCFSSPENITACFKINAYDECVFERVEIPRENAITQIIEISSMNYTLNHEEITGILESALYVTCDPDSSELEASIFNPQFEPSLSMHVEKSQGGRSMSYNNTYEYFDPDYPELSVTATHGDTTKIVNDYKNNRAFVYTNDYGVRHCEFSQMQTILVDSQVDQTWQDFRARHQQKRLFWDFGRKYFDLGLIVYEGKIYRRLSFTDNQDIIIDEEPVEGVAINLLIDEASYQKGKGSIEPKKLIFGSNQYPELQTVYSYERIGAKDEWAVAARSYLEFHNPRECTFETTSLFSMLPFSKPLEGYGYFRGPYIEVKDMSECARYCLKTTGCVGISYHYYDDVIFSACWPVNQLPGFQGLQTSRKKSLFSKLLFREIQ